MALHVTVPLFVFRVLEYQPRGLGPHAARRGLVVPLGVEHPHGRVSKELPDLRDVARDAAADISTSFNPNLVFVFICLASIRC